VHPEDEGDMFLGKRRLTLNGQHGVISQKMVLFKLYKSIIMEGLKYKINKKFWEELIAYFP
jgi:hypothetical protein